MVFTLLLLLLSEPWLVIALNIITIRWFVGNSLYDKVRELFFFLFTFSFYIPNYVIRSIYVGISYHTNVYLGLVGCRDKLALSRSSFCTLPFLFGICIIKSFFPFLHFPKIVVMDDQWSMTMTIFSLFHVINIFDDQKYGWFMLHGCPLPYTWLSIVFKCFND